MLILIGEDLICQVSWDENDEPNEPKNLLIHTQATGAFTALWTWREQSLLICTFLCGMFPHHKNV